MHEIEQRRCSAGLLHPTRAQHPARSARCPFRMIIGGNPRFLPRTNIFPHRHRPVEKHARSGRCTDSLRAPLAMPTAPSPQGRAGIPQLRALPLKGSVVETR